MSKITVIGAGSWGTALAQVLADNQHEVMLYAIEESVVQDINENHQNSRFFSDVVLPKNIKATLDLKLALHDAQFVLLSVPTKVMRDVLTSMKTFLSPHMVVINASKGIEPGTHKRVSEVVSEVLGEETTFVTLSGPSHAEEVILREITTVTCAGNHVNRLLDIQELFSNQYFRVYRTDDLIGVEVGGSIKNVMALGSGILAGLGYGDNARAMLITRSLIEIKRLGVALGAKEETFDGLSGLGDLIVTTMSKHSRNFQAGFKIGSGSDLNEALDNMKMVVEGVRSCQATYELAQKLEIHMPFVGAIYDVVFNRNNPKDVIEKMMQRPLMAENPKEA
ncbi:MAG: NAD(P)H-dependent glycerol-3-phosphate dehydrogenase [Defluviitaleaceae bacterium]|nr:NAD(P)H-dependent glycerol-3-phosphate dehydrogenase [Defluviitaleaceae bacterium]